MSQPLEREQKTLCFKRTYPALGIHERGSDHRSCARRPTLLNSGFVESSGDTQPTVTRRHHESVHARDRSRNVHPREQITIGSFRKNLVNAKAGGSNEPSSIKYTPMHRMIVV